MKEILHNYAGNCLEIILPFECPNAFVPGPLVLVTCYDFSYQACVTKRTSYFDKAKIVTSWYTR